MATFNMPTIYVDFEFYAIDRICGLNLSGWWDEGENIYVYACEISEFMDEKRSI